MPADSDRLEIVATQRSTILTGVAVLVVGLCFDCGALAGVLRHGFGEATRFAFPALFGSVFTLIGVTMSFGRGGVALDRRAGRFVKWSRLLFLNREKAVPLDAPSRVTLTRAVRRAHREVDETTTYEVTRYSVFPVHIAHGRGRSEIVELEDYEIARNIAEKCARFFDLPLADNARGALKLEQPEELGITLSERIRQRGGAEGIPSIPAGCRVRRESVGGFVKLQVAPPGIPPALWRGIDKGALWAMAGGALLIQIFPEERREGVSFWIWVTLMAGAAMVAWLLRPAFAVLRGRSREVLSVSPKSLELTVLSPIGSKTTAIPAEELRELVVWVLPGAGDAAEFAPEFLRRWTRLWGGNAVIVARTSGKSLMFGRGATGPEAEWIRAQIEQALID